MQRMLHGQVVHIYLVNTCWVHMHTLTPTRGTDEKVQMRLNTCRLSRLQTIGEVLIHLLSGNTRQGPAWRDDHKEN